MPQYEDWIAAAGPRAVSDEAATIPDDVLSDPGLSLMAKALYALLLAHRGRPLDPYDDAIEAEEDIAAAVEELIAAGLAVRVDR